MENDPRYVPVALTLPARLPPITRIEAARRADMLVRRFGKMGLGSPNQTRAASLNDWGISVHQGRRCWASTAPTAGHNHYNGWGRLIHDVSHIVFARRHPTFRPHDGGHAALEREIAAYVVRKGWLEPKRKEAPSEAALAQQKHERLLIRLKRWEAKQRRAANAIKKLKRALARHERSLQH